MKLSLRFFFAFVLIVGLASWLFFREYSAELVPGMRQSLEEALVDTANLLAEMVQADVVQGTLAGTSFADAFERFNQRHLNAEIWTLKRRLPNLFVYITDARGIVIYDSRGIGVGADYSRWNDVYKTLRGEYGARTSRDIPADPTSSVMYVAAPIRTGDRIIGVLTVAKPSMSVQPYIEQMRANLLVKALWLILLSLVLAALLTYGLTRSIGRLTRYAGAVQAGKRVEPPTLHEPELRELAEAMESMRTALEGKDYVEKYLHTLTHELKSPLAAIQGASELLHEQMPVEERRRFLANIAKETRRMQQVVERLLGLAVLEKRQGLQQPEAVDMQALLSDVCESRMPVVLGRGLALKMGGNPRVFITGERFLLSQAIGNLLDNAIEFSSDGGDIEVDACIDGNTWQLSVADLGTGIPGYAMERLFERFFSLPRPDGGGKSSGLGLAFVREVVELHGGSIRLENRTDTQGARATLRLPLLT